MKDLKTHIVEVVKPPRLSAKNRDLWANNKPLDEKEVMNWLEKNCNIKGKVEIVDGKINVKGGVVVKDDVEEFPYPFGEVTGYFDCYRCKELKSLKNSPQRVGGYFDCSYCNNLKSLEGAPKEVGGNFWCSYCDNLTSLEGAPEEVGGNFYCYFCGKKFTKKDVENVCEVKGYIWV